jgi:hypothetical protein
MVSNDGGLTYTTTGDVKTADHIKFDITRDAATDNFATDVTDGFLGNFTIDVTTGPVSPNSFSYGNAGWGMFVADSYVLQVLGAETRTIGLLGNFFPGSNLSAFDPNTASIVLQFTQSGGPGNSISGSLSLHSPAEPLGVPEPATMTLAGIGLGFCAVGGYIRRRRALASA